MKTNKDIKYGDVEVDLKNIDDSEVKIRITTMLDKDVLLTLKENAKALGTRYQSYLNQHLRETLLNEQGLLTRIDKLEKAVLKKQA